MGFHDSREHGALAVVEVTRSRQVSPNFVRITVAGEQLAAIPARGFDHWFRMFLPREEGETSFALPGRVDTLGYLKYRRMPAAVRPHMRNYTVRSFRPDQHELDIDFVVHGDDGIASRWAARARPGDRVALIDQGIGYTYDPGTEAHLLVGDETAVPAVAGILRSLPRDARGAAYLEVAHADDAQPTDAPEGVEVHWLVREPGAKPGTLALDEVPRHPLPAGRLSVYVAGEQALPAGLRRWLVAEHAVPKKDITFVGYWRLGKASTD